LKDNNLDNMDTAETKSVEETDLISELSTAAENADISAVEAEKIAEDIENAVD